MFISKKIVQCVKRNNKNNYSQFAVLIFFLTQIIGFKTNAQTIDSLAWDGSLYVKVKTNSNVTIQDFSMNSNINILPTEIQALVAQYNIISIKKAFPTVTNDSLISKTYKLIFSNYDKISTLIRDLQSIDFIEYAEKIPIDKIYCTNEYNIWNVANSAQFYHLNKVQACDAWTINQGNSNVRIAILDNEFDITHPELANKTAPIVGNCNSVWDVADNDNSVNGPNANFDHGTHVAGIVGAQTNNGNGGVASLGNNLKLMLGKVAGDMIGGFPNNNSWITHGYEGIVWATNNCANVINNSWGGVLYSQTNQNIINWASNQGVIIVAAAGNDNNSLPHYPAAYTNVFAVANTDQNDNKYQIIPGVQGGSCFGTWVDISAPGTSIYSTISSVVGGVNAYGYKTGTSMAAPMVSALCGLIKSVNASYTPQMVLNCITGTADDIYTNIPANAPYIGLLGSGRINAFHALQCSQSPGNSVTFTSNVSTICENTSVSFTDLSFTNSPITSWLWNFGDGFTSPIQNPTHIYTNSGEYDVSLTVVTANGTYSWTITNMINVIGVSMITSATTNPICRGQEAQYNINFSGIPAYSMVYNLNGGANLSYSTNFTPGQIYFNTNQNTNTLLNIVSITSNGISCPINKSISVNTIECCGNNIITNGDFDSGNTAFSTQQILVGVNNLLCPGLYNVDVYSGPSAVPPGSVLYPTNKGNALFVDGRAYKWCPAAGYQNTCGINFPQNTELPCSNGIFPNQSSILWEQSNVNLSTNYSYILSLYASQGNVIVNTVQSIKLRIRVLNQGSPIYNSIIELPYTNNNTWQQFAFNIDQNLLGSPNNFLNCTVQIEQYENFQWNNFDFIIDEIRLFRYIPLTLNTNIAGNNLAGGLNSPCTITALPNGNNYTWTWAGPSGTPSNNTLTNVTVAGIYTCTVTDATGCTRSSTIQILDLCNPNNLPQNAIKITPQNNITTSSALINFNAGLPIITTNNVIFISGTFTIDQSISFINCPNIFLDADAKIDLANGATLNINNCKLQAICNTMWDRIYAQSASNQIIITNSTIRDMKSGILLYNSAKINAVNNIFKDNYASMQIANAGINYNMSYQKCRVLNNTFTSSGNNLLIPYNTQSKSEYGIIIGNCREVEIGYYGTSSYINNFTNLYNGIRIFPGSYYQTEVYKFYSNNFRDIRDDIPAGTLSADLYRMNNIYSNHRGAGIYSAPRDGQPYPMTMTNYHYADIAASGGQHGFAEFNNCDKAVSFNATGANIRGYQVNRSFCGYMFGSADIQNYKIEGNAMNDPLIGIQILNNPSQCQIVKNNIILRPLGVNFFFFNFVRIPVGIDINNFNNPGSYYEISNNGITMPGIYATGIRLTNTGKQLYVQNNNIYMTTTSNVSSYCGWGCSTELRGIHATNSNESKLMCNHIFGLTNVQAYNARPAAGIRFNATKNMYVNNNTVNNTSFGFLAVSDNTTYPDRISCNQFTNHQFGWLFRHLGTEGSFGNQIGNAGYGDMMNQFGGIGYWSNYKIYRMTNANFPGVIYTNLFTQANSSSTIGINGAYKRNIPTGANYPCSSSCGGYNNGGNGGGQGSGGGLTTNWLISQMLQVIEDSVNYPEYPQVAKWLDELQHYTALSEDESLLSVNAIVDSFYSLMQTSNINSITETNESIYSLLTDSLALTDSVYYSNLLEEAISHNDEIISGADQEMNEQMVNNLYFKSLRFGIFSLDEDDKTSLESLAKQCPYIGGSAVYKARTLWANFEPANDYDDIALCNAAGVYKNGKGVFDDENNWLNNLNYENGSSPYANLREGQVKIYPNPSDGQISINYQIAKEDIASMYILDLLGREVITVSLSSNNNNVSLKVPFTSTGIFVYKLIINGVQRQTGKLIFEK